MRQGLRRRRNRHHRAVQGNQPRTRRVNRNAAVNALRAPAERANALLKATWPVLRRITPDPWRITEIAAAALVLLHLQWPITE